MKILNIQEDDIEECSDALKEELGEQFIRDGYTHLRCNGILFDVWKTHNIVFLGEELEQL